MTDPPATSDHAAHDTMLVASLADHSLGAAERAAAEALVAACGALRRPPRRPRSTLRRRDPGACRRRPGRATTRSRAGDAARLRSRRLAPARRRHRVARATRFSRPLAVGLTTLGLAGLLVATVPSMLLRRRRVVGSAAPVGAPPAVATGARRPGVGAVARRRRAGAADRAARPRPRPARASHRPPRRPRERGRTGRPRRPMPRASQPSRVAIRLSRSRRRPTARRAADQRARQASTGSAGSGVDHGANRDRRAVARPRAAPSLVARLGRVPARRRARAVRSARAGRRGDRCPGALTRPTAALATSLAGGPRRTLEAVPTERLMLLDGNGLIYRGYFALPPLTTSKGELVNAVFGFCSIVLRGFQDIKPDYVAVAFDLQGPTFRHEQYAEYKATRQRMPDDLRDQFPKVREVVKALRIPVYELAGLRGRRRHRHARRRGRAARPRDDDRDRRPRHAPARHRPHAADDDRGPGSRTRSSTTRRGSTSGTASCPAR